MAKKMFRVLNGIRSEGHQNRPPKHAAEQIAESGKSLVKLFRTRNIDDQAQVPSRGRDSQETSQRLIEIQSRNLRSCRSIRIKLHEGISKPRRALQRVASMLKRVQHLIRQRTGHVALNDLERVRTDPRRSQDCRRFPLK